MEYQVQVHYGNHPDAPYVTYRTESEGNFSAGEQVVLLFLNTQAPVIAGKLADDTIPEVTDFFRGQTFYNVPHIEGLAFEAEDVPYVTFINGDPNKPIIIQNIDTTTRIEVTEWFSNQIVKAYPPKGVTISDPEQEVIVDFPGGDINNGVIIYYGFLSTLTIFGTTTLNNGGLWGSHRWGMQRKIFYDDVNARFWSFNAHQDGSYVRLAFCSAPSSTLVFDSATMVDGIRTTSEIDGSAIAVTFKNAEGVAYVYAVWMSSLTDEVLWCRGQLNSDGTVSWGSQYQIDETAGNKYPSIAVDSDGYCWIAFTRTNSVHVYKNSLNDGSWSSASGFPQVWSGGNYSLAKHTSLNPMLDGKMYLCYSYGGATLTDMGIRGCYWDGSTWASTAEGVVITGLMNTYKHWVSVAVDNVVHVCYLGPNGQAIGVAPYGGWVYRAAGGTSWTSYQKLWEDTYYACPAMGRTEAGDVIVMWIPYDNATDYKPVYYRRYHSNIWSVATALVEDVYAPIQSAESTLAYVDNSNKTCYAWQTSESWLHFLCLDVTP